MISYPWDSIVEAIGDDGFPVYDRDYKAADLQSLNGRIFSNGVFMDEPDAFVVTPAEGMNVILSTGWCCINGTFGNEPNMRELAIQSSASTQDRIDTVVLRWNANIEMRNIDVYVKTGVASDVPVRPQLTRDSTVYEIGIADIFVARGSGAISAARITDTRLQTDRCGAVTPFMQIDTTTFFNQIQAAIDERTAELEEQTAKAVELAQSAIDGTTAGKLQSQIDANKARIQENTDTIEVNKKDSDEKWDSLSRGQSGLILVPANTNGIVREFGFGRTYEEPPIVLVSCQSSGGGNSQGFPCVRVAGVSTDGFSVVIHSNAGVSYNIKVNWIAIPA